MQITFIQSDGTAEVAPGEIGSSVMHAARAAGIPGIAADCGGTCACATCQVLVDPAWLPLLPPPDEIEDTMLEFGCEDRQENSRLACQISVTEALDGMVVRVPHGPR